MNARTFGAHRASWRPLLIGALAAMLALSGLVATASAKLALAGDDRPTIVLVHGAWAGPPAWKQVVSELRERGFKTVTPKLDLLSIEGDVAIVRAALDSIRGKKILVAHSYGGVVISNASAGRTDVKALVYTAAFVPDAGDSILSLGHDYTPTAALANLVWTGVPFESLSFLNPATFRAIFAADLSPEKAGVQNGGQQPASPALLVSPSGPVGWHTIPSWYAISGKDLIIDPALQRFMAERAGATIIEFPNASHVGGFSVHDERFTRLIEQAVKATR